MATSQNGWPVVGQDAVVDRAVHGAEFPNGWLKGDVDVVFTYLIGRLHREVEPIHVGGCWGWYVKGIEGSTAVSNHASATAIDYNAPAHPMGTRNTYSAADRVKIRAILADLAGVVRWGGDYTGRPDDMHFEINATRAAVARVADWIREQQKEADMNAAEMTAWANSAPGQAAMSRAAGIGVHNQRIGRSEMTIGVAFENLLYAAHVELAEVPPTAEQNAQAVVDALGAGRSPEQVAASLRQVPGVDWSAVGRALTQ